MEKNRGVVLRSLIPKKQKVTLLDEELGRIDAILGGNLAKLTMIQNGAQLAYYPVKRGSAFLLDEIELLAMPLQLARTNIEMIHHILELCYFYMPDGNRSTSIFNLLVTIMQWPHPMDTHEIILIKTSFFLNIGIYAEDVPFSEAELDILLNKNNYAIFMKKTLDEKRYKMIQSWLDHCLALHPNIHLFKTIGNGT